MSATDYRFEGWAAQGKDSTKGKLEFIDYSDEVRQHLSLFDRKFFLLTLLFSFYRSSPSARTMLTSRSCTAVSARMFTFPDPGFDANSFRFFPSLYETTQLTLRYSSDLHTMSGGWGEVPYPQVSPLDSEEAKKMRTD